MMIEKNAVIHNRNKNLSVDKDFIIFVREKGKDLPYVAMRVNDISLFK